MAEKKTFMIEGAELLFRNFQGRATDYKPAGNREFSVVIPSEEHAEILMNDGWNVKRLRPQEGEEVGRPFISVSVRFDILPPFIMLITSKARLTVGEDTVETLDWVNIANCDLIAREYNWTVGEKSGMKAYLQSMYITVDEDFLALKYAVDPFPNGTEGA